MQSTGTVFYQIGFIGGRAITLVFFVIGRIFGINSRRQKSPKQVIPNSKRIYAYLVIPEFFIGNLFKYEFIGIGIRCDGLVI